MKAAVYHGPRDIRVEKVSNPEITENQMLIRVRACGICGSDLHMYRLGMFGNELGKPIQQGRIMGHELSGEVIAVGPEIEGFRVGDRVTSVGQGGFAEYTTLPLPGRAVHLLPEKIDFEEGALMEPLATCVHAVALAGVASGETAVLLGAGIIGLGCLQVIKASIDCHIIMVDSSEKRLDMARQLGADGTVNLTVTDPLEAVIDLTGGAKPVVRYGVRGGNADVVIDCAGAQTSPNQGLLMLKQMYGRMVFVALFEHPAALDFNQVVRKHVSITGSWTWTDDDYRKAIALVESGRVDRKPLISHIFPLTDAAEAFAMQDSPEAAIKVLLKP